MSRRSVIITSLICVAIVAGATVGIVFFVRYLNSFGPEEPRTFTLKFKQSNYYLELYIGYNCYVSIYRGKVLLGIMLIIFRERILVMFAQKFCLSVPIRPSFIFMRLALNLYSCEHTSETSNLNQHLR